MITASPHGKVIKGKGAQGRVWARPEESQLPAALSQGSAVDSPALTVPAAAGDNTHKVFPPGQLAEPWCPGSALGVAHMATKHQHSSLDIGESQSCQNKVM